jgi:hypothetical protein
MIPITKIIPPPPENNNPPSPQTTALPWSLLEVGESFLVPYDGVEPSLLFTRVNGLKSFQKRKQPGTNFIIRTLPDGIRVWRTR